MKHSAIGRGIRAATLVVVGAIVVGAPSEAHAQGAFPDVCKIRFDERRTAALLERRGDGGMAVSELLRQVASVEVHGQAPARLVLYVYLMRGDEVVRRYTSRPFDAPARGVVSLRDVLPAGEPDFGSFSFDPAHLLEAETMVPAGAAADEPGRFIINGVIPLHPSGWERMAGLYVVAVPVSGELTTRSRDDIGWPILKEAPVGIGVLFGTPARSGR